MKKIIGALLVVCMSISLIFAMTSCDYSKNLNDKEYNNKVNAYAFWDNDITQAIPQTNVSSLIREFLSTKSEDGKPKKVLFLGYDGCRADRIKDILDAETGEVLPNRDSAILETLSSDDSGIYLAYAGGNMGTSTRQPTVTGCGWASLLTGVWGNKHKIKDNRDTKNPKYTSLVIDSATGKFGKEYSSAFVASCTMHFATQYIDEINYLYDNPKAGAKMPAKKKHEEFIKKKMEWSETYYDDDVREYVDSVVANTRIPAKYIFTRSDNAPEGYVGYYGDVNTKDEMIKAINNGTDVVFGIIEETDHVGHNIGFSKGANDSPEYIEAFERQEKLGAEVIRTAKNRAEEKNEDWLIIMTTDHGGYDDYHGQQSFEERTIWVACNKKIDAKYFSKEYDGFKGKQ